MLATTFVVIGAALAGASTALPPVLVSSREGDEVVFRLITDDSNQVIAREANPDDRGVRFVFAASSDGKRFLRIRPSTNGKVATIIASGIDGKVIGEYIFEVGDTAAWWYGWAGERAYALHSLPSGKWKYWVPGNKVEEVTEARLPASFRNAIAKSPNKEFHSTYPESTEWTIGYLSDAPNTVVPESPYTFVSESGIGSYDSSSASHFAHGRLIAIRRPYDLSAWWNVRYIGGSRFLAIGMHKNDVEPLGGVDPGHAGRPFLKTSAWLIDALTQDATRIGYAVYAVPIPRV